MSGKTNLRQNMKLPKLSDEDLQQIENIVKLCHDENGLCITSILDNKDKDNPFSYSNVELNDLKKINLTIQNQRNLEREQQDEEKFVSDQIINEKFDYNKILF